VGVPNELQPFAISSPVINSYAGVSDEDRLWLYRTVYGEVRNQSDAEQQAVCQVIYNRWKAGSFGATVKDVVLAPKQFSVWNPDDRQHRNLLHDSIWARPNMLRVRSNCDLVFEQRANGIDTSRGINHFYHPAGMKKTKHHKARKPLWAYNNVDVQLSIGIGVYITKPL
jgi:hypothetical protein